ncbi:MAG: hypothetical protein LBT97_02295 [Planctomycetota bacterium]|jgi:hypothetical protein|nr:hypothetical protein [Planctomycetota bacterium]
MLCAISHIVERRVRHVHARRGEYIKVHRQGWFGGGKDDGSGCLGIIIVLAIFCALFGGC